MALIKTHRVPQGVDCNYWRILTCELDLVANKLRANIGLYVSKELRQAGARPIERAHFEGELPPLDARGKNDAVKLAYEAMKLAPEFQGAIDD